MKRFVVKPQNEQNGKLPDKINDSIFDALKFNIERANEITRLYGDQVKYYLEINLVLMTVYSIILSFLWQPFNSLGKFAILTAIIAYLINTLYTIFKVLTHPDTKKEKTLNFYKDWNDNIDFSSFNEKYYFDDLCIQLKNLHRFQENYYTLAFKTSKNTLRGVVILILGIITIFIVDFIGIMLKIQ